jgi:hypothetical protein
MSVVDQALLKTCSGQLSIVPGGSTPWTPARRSALDPAPFLLDTQKKGGKENVPRRLPRAVLTGGPQMSLRDRSLSASPPNRDRLGSRAYRRHNGPHRNRQNVVLKTPQGDGESKTIK